MQNVLEMKKLATEATDDRVRYSANKDILDRIGLAPTQKQVSYTPSDYFRLLEGLKKKKAPDGDPEPGPGLGPDGALPSPGVHPAGEPAGDGERA